VEIDMLTLVIAVLSIHVLTAVFWAGTTFVQARTGAAGGEKLLRPQLGSGAVAIVFGVILWGLLHRGGFGPVERVLAVGAVAAVAAEGVLGAMGGPAARKLRADPADTAARARLAAAQRIGALLLAATLICMVTAKYA
jgi:hypothetical protein